MPILNTLDGPIELDASDDLLLDVQDALSFWYAYGRHPYRSLGGVRSFMITTADFRYVDSPRYWRFTAEQTIDLLRKLWPDESRAILLRLEQDYRR